MFRKAAWIAASVSGIALITCFVVATGVMGFINGVAITAISLGLLLLVSAGIAYQGFVNIPADPPTIAILTFLGRRVGVVLREGVKILPLRPFLFGHIPVDKRKRNKDLQDVPVRTPDKAPLNINISVTWSPDTSEDVDPVTGNIPLINFLNSGGEEGVNNILEDMLRERLRIWAQSPHEGPERWSQAVGATEEAVAILLKRIVAEDLHHIDAPFPTPLLLKFYAEPQRPPVTKREEDIGGKEWHKIHAYTESLPDKGMALRQSVEERRDIIMKAAQGNGRFRKRDLGIVIHRLNVEHITPTGKVAESAELPEKERLEGEAEKIEAENLAARVKELIEGGFTREQAIEAFQAERGKITKAVTKMEFGVPPETQGMLERLVGAITARILRIG